MRIYAPVLCILILVAGCTGIWTEDPGDGASSPSPPAGLIEAEAWSEADAILRNAPCWLGSDGGHTVDLGDDRVLWLFGDSRVKAPTHDVDGDSHFLHNTIAIMEGKNPTTASISFHWSRPAETSTPGEAGICNPGGEPEAFFPDEGEQWFWPGPGSVIQGNLVIFASIVESTGGDGPFNFQGVGWTAFHIQNPGDAPADWTLSRGDLPETDYGLTFAGTTFQHDGYLYAYAFDSEPPQTAFLARWPEGQAANGDLTRPSWWWDEPTGWAQEPPSNTSSPAEVLRGATPGFTVHQDPDSGRWIETRVSGFGAANITMRFADSPEGPWSPSQVVYEPPEAQQEERLVYAALAHPELEGGDTVVTYYPDGAEAARFVRVTHGG